jgi:recombination protein RecT
MTDTPQATRPAGGRDMAAVDAAAVEVVRDELARGRMAAFLGRYADDITSVAPKHVPPEAFLGLAAAYVRRSPDLRQAAAVNPGSLVLALRECAALGHLPQPKTFALVAFKAKDAPGGRQIQGIETYHGVVDRMFRAGGVRAVHCEVVRETDPVARFQRGRMSLPLHEYDEFATPAERGALKAVYAWAELQSGALSAVAWLNRYAVARRRASSHANADRFWGRGFNVATEVRELLPEGEGPNTEAMWRKSALLELESWVPTSAAYRWEVAQSTAAQALPTKDNYQQPDPEETITVEAEIATPGGPGE